MYHHVRTSFPRVDRGLYYHIRTSFPRVDRGLYYHIRTSFPRVDRGLYYHIRTSFPRVNRGLYYHIHTLLRVFFSGVAGDGTVVLGPDGGVSTGTSRCSDRPDRDGVTAAGITVA